jgi:prepilin-type N-terminal cleavage/methylation domain-containing protein
MNLRHVSFRRGLTLIELVLALAITAMVAAAIGVMISAIESGESARRDNRDMVVRAYAASTRLSAYIASSMSVLKVGSLDAVVWVNDWREGGTVHATELRWIVFDTVTESIDVYFVDFPDEWNDVQQALQDNEYLPGTDWSVVLSSYNAAGYVSNITLVDGVSSIAITTDQPVAVDSTSITFDIGFHLEATDETVNRALTITILKHQPPTA